MGRRAEDYEGDPQDFARTQTWDCSVEAAGRSERPAGRVRRGKIPSEETRKEATLCKRAGSDIQLEPESAVCQALMEPSAWMRSVFTDKAMKAVKRNESRSSAGGMRGN